MWVLALRVRWLICVFAAETLRREQRPQVREGPWKETIPRFQGLEDVHYCLGNGYFCASGGLPVLVRQMEAVEEMTWHGMK